MPRHDQEWLRMLWPVVAVVGLATAGAILCWWMLPVPDEETGPRVDPDPARAAVVTAEVPEETEFQKMGPRYPPIVDIPRQPVAVALRGVAPSELVLGVTVDGESRAYPLNMINGPSREVLNDVLGGQPIVVTWCPVCHHGQAYSRQVEGQVLTLGVSGLLWNLNLVMYDEQTESRWIQFSGEARSGPLQGKSLTPLDSIMTDWATWSARHPAGTVALLSRTFYNFRLSYYRDRSRFVLVSTATNPPKAWGFDTLDAAPILNVVLDDQPALVSFDRASVTARLFDRRVADQTLTFRASGAWWADDQTGSLWDPIEGRAVFGTYAGLRLETLPSLVAFREVWLSIHPDTQILPAISMADPGRGSE